MQKTEEGTFWNAKYLPILLFNLIVFIKSTQCTHPNHTPFHLQLFCVYQCHTVYRWSLVSMEFTNGNTFPCTQIYKYGTVYIIGDSYVQHNVIMCEYHFTYLPFCIAKNSQTMYKIF